ncbi:MAG: DUF1924 domain-containing protein [Sterolibacterium sp.]
MHRLIGSIALATGLGLAGAAWSAPTQDILRGYENEARQANAGFKPNAARGEAFFRSEHASIKGDGNKLSCAGCHTSDPRQSGMTRAHKRIEPLAPAANPARFSDAAKVEKWFGRNCQDVLERACTAAEKADLIQWLSTVR